MNQGFPKEMLEKIDMLQNRMTMPSMQQQNNTNNNNNNQKTINDNINNEDKNQLFKNNNNVQQNNLNVINNLYNQQQQLQQLKRKNSSLQNSSQQQQQQEVSTKARVLNSAKVLFQNNENSNSISKESNESLQNNNNNNINKQQGIGSKKGQKNQDKKITEFFGKQQQKKKTPKKSPSIKKEKIEIKQQQQQSKQNSNIQSNSNSNNTDYLAENESLNTISSKNKNSIDQQDVEQNENSGQCQKIDKNEQQIQEQSCQESEQQNKLQQYQNQSNEELMQIIEQLQQDVQNKDKTLESTEKENKMLKKQLCYNQYKVNIFRKQVSQTLQKCLLEKERLYKSDRKNKIIQKKHRLGELTCVRDGTKFNEIWIDGFEIQQVKSKLYQIAKEKEELERQRKNLKGGSSQKGRGMFPKNQKNGQQNNQNCSNQVDFFSGNNSISNNNSQSFQNQYNCNLNIGSQQGQSDDQNQNENNQDQIEETKKRITFQIAMLSKDEQLFNQQLNNLQIEKYNFIKECKLIQEEEHSRYANEEYGEFQLPILGKQYQILSLLGKGGFSEVYKAFDLENLRDVAIKIHQLNPTWSESSKSNYIRHALREADVQIQLNHQNIVKLYNTIEIDGNTFATVQEFCDGQDLSQSLKAHGSFSEKDAKQIIKQIVQGLNYMNSSSTKIIHYDLKPQNIIFHKGEVKITDFGLCKVMDNNSTTRMELTSQGVGTYWYLPPECFVTEEIQQEQPDIFQNSQMNYQNNNNPQVPQISPKVDIWSVGIILYEMIYGQKPFGNKMSQQQILKDKVILNSKQVLFPPKPTISNECKDFIKKCLAYDQNNRINVQDALKHVFLSGVGSIKNSTSNNNNNQNSQSNLTTGRIFSQFGKKK